MRPKAFAGIKLQQRDPLHDFAFRFFEDLTLLARERAGNFVGPLARDVCCAPEYASPLRAWCFLPAPEGRLGGVDGALDVLCSGSRKLADHIVEICGIDVADEPRRLWMKPFAVDIRTGMHSDLPTRQLARLPSTLAKTMTACKPRSGHAWFKTVKPFKPFKTSVKTERSG